MTLDTFLDLVPWSEMELRRYEKARAGEVIRHRVSGLCPICVVWGGPNAAAASIARGHLNRLDRNLVILAADGIGNQVRENMLKRMGVQS